MKKKIAVLFLASILALSAAACNSGSSGTASNVESAGNSTSSTSSVAENGTDSKAESKTDDKAESKADESKSETSSANVDVKDLIKKSYADVVKDGKYYMSMTIDASAMASLGSSSDTPSSYNGSSSGFS